jgi:enamine deaminase RidA (YjgF/YER057c/UK114 family)
MTPVAGRIEKRLAELGIVLPAPVPPFNSYVPWVQTGALVFISGQGPFVDRGIPARFKGRVPDEIPIERAQEAARLTALSVLAQLKAACGGDLDRVVRCVQLLGYVNAMPGFTETPRVVNGGSDLMVAVFGEAGRHSRVAVGSPALPENIAVEIAAIFEIGPPPRRKKNAKGRKR